MKQKLIVGVVAAGFALGASVCPALAQTEPPATPATAPQNDPAARPTLRPTYRISPEDVLSIVVQNRPEVSREDVAVLQDGTIDLPYAGQMKVAGKTIKELKDEVTKRLDKYFVRPQVTISVRARQARQVNIIGAVKQPGKLPLREGWRLLDVLTAAGIESDRFEFYRAELVQNRTNQRIPVDLQKLLGDKDPSLNLPVEADDLIMVSRVDEAQTSVQVVGQVAKPGPVVVPRNGSVVDVLQAAGGPTDGARLSQVTLLRDGKPTVIDMRDYQKNGFDPGIKLQAGDRLTVPLNTQRIRVFGAVGRPGELPYPDDRNLTVYSAIAYAGGVTNGAELKKTRLTRTDATGATTSREFNVEKMLKTGDLSGDAPIEPGDSLYVPTSSQRRGLDPFQIVGVVGAIPILYGIFTGRIFR